MKSFLSRTSLYAWMVAIPLLMFLAGIRAYAQNQTPGTGGHNPPLGIVNPLKGVSTLSQLIEAVIGFFLTFGIYLGVFFIVLSGFKFVMARGNTTKLGEAKSMLLWTLIGLGVVLAAKFFAAVIEQTIFNIGVTSV